MMVNMSVALPSAKGTYISTLDSIQRVTSGTLLGRSLIFTLPGKLRPGRSITHNLFTEYIANV